MSWAKQLAKEGKIVEVGRSFCHREHFRSSHAAGWSNAPLPGSQAGADAVLHKIASPTTIVEEVRRLAGE